MFNFINSIPFPFTLKHFYVSDVDVKSIDSPNDWDILRTQDEHFSISENRNEWLRAVEGKLSRANGDIKKDGHSGSFIPFSKDVIEFIRSKGFKRVFSVGVGIGGLEYQIKKNMPEIEMVCSEYAPKSVEMLKKVFTEADKIIEFDIKDEWGVIDKDTLVIMYRIDPHLTDKEWIRLFKTIPAENVLFIPNAFLTIKLAIKELWNRNKGVFSGYVRTKKGYIFLWKKSFNFVEIPFSGNSGFYLKKIYGNSI